VYAPLLEVSDSPFSSFCPSVSVSPTAVTPFSKVEHDAAEPTDPAGACMAFCSPQFKRLTNG
jgi:hypothetical protein